MTHGDVEVVEVPDPWLMDADTFCKHLEKRHAAECRIENVIKRDALDEWITTYRVFHDRLHQIAAPGQYDHVHVGPEEPEEEDDE